MEWKSGSYPLSDIQDYFNYIIQKHEKVTNNPPIKIHVNKIENKFSFKIKSGYCPQLLMAEMMKLFGSTKSKITKEENVYQLEIAEYY